MENKKYFKHETAIVSDESIIGSNTKIWHFSHIREGCEIGNDVSIGQNVYIDTGVKIGNNCKIQNNVSIYKGVTIEDNVFIGDFCSLGPKKLTLGSNFSTNNTNLSSFFKFKGLFIRQSVSK